MFREKSRATFPQVVVEIGCEVRRSALNIRRDLLHLGRTGGPTAALHHRQEAHDDPDHHQDRSAQGDQPTAKPAPTKQQLAKATAPQEPTTTPAKPKAEKPAGPVPTSLREALAQRAAVLVKVRANGTVRSLPYLAPGSPERVAAEAVAARVAKGEEVPAIAEDMKVSLATARRFLTNLALDQEVEAGKHDAAWKPGHQERHRPRREAEQVRRWRTVPTVRVHIEQRGDGDLSWVVVVGDSVAVSGLTVPTPSVNAGGCGGRSPSSEQRPGSASPAADRHSRTRGVGLQACPS